MKPVEQEKVMLVHDSRRLTRPQIESQHWQEQSQRQEKYLMPVASYNYVRNFIKDSISAAPKKITTATLQAFYLDSPHYTGDSGKFVLSGQD